MKILPNGIAVIERCSHFTKWIEECGRLDHDWKNLDQFRQFIPAGSTVLDAGAYIGDVTCWLSKQVGPTGTVIAFEPNREPYQCLIHNVPEAVTFQCGLSNRADFLYFLREQENIGASRVVWFGEKGDCKSLIPVLTLDSLRLERLDFMKLDCESMEPYIIEGGEATIKRLRPVILLEFNCERLHENGFNARTLDRMIVEMGYKVHWRGEGDVQFDACYVPK